MYPVYPNGTRVVYTGGQWNHVIGVGRTGTVVETVSGKYPIVFVSWDNFSFGHDCGGLCKDGTGWNVTYNEITPIQIDDRYDEQCDADINGLLFG